MIGKNNVKMLASVFSAFVILYAFCFLVKAQSAEYGSDAYGNSVYGDASNPADINNDSVVDVLDLTFVTIRFGSKAGDSGWNSSADLVASSEIDIYDVVFVTSRFT